MKTINYLLFCIVCVIIISCQEKTFDLATIKLGESADKYKLEKKIMFDEAPLRSSSDNVSDFDTNDDYRFTYGEIPTDSSLSAWITIVDNKIACIDLCIQNEYTLQFAEKLLFELGTPTAMFVEQTNIDSEIGREIFNNIHTVFPDSTQWNEDSNYPLKFPYVIFWEKENVYYIYSMAVDYDGSMRNRYLPVTKEAFRTGKIFWYPYPLPENSPLYNYMK